MMHAPAPGFSAPRPGTPAARRKKMALQVREMRLGLLSVVTAALLLQVPLHACYRYQLMGHCVEEHTVCTAKMNNGRFMDLDCVW